MQIRRAIVTDARRIAEISVETWLATYAGLMPQELLAQIDVNRREERWKEALQNPEELVFVADEAGDVLGFASGGKERTGSEYDGEVFAIYVRPNYQGRGAGKALMRAMARALRGRGFTGILVWVAKGNPSCVFYEKGGGTLHTSRTETMRGFEVEEVSYVWDRAALAALCED